MPGLYTLIHERYRNPAGQKSTTVFETDAWFHVEDLMSNFLKKRVVISVSLLGGEGRGVEGEGVLKSSGQSAT
jgi:hypothetical protein